ncbi:MAG: peptide chain release factor N(5)-glutamine methyltransferase [Acidobacteriota bacterium]|nr:peptide chain release factor N(5)-glutamine methyltransferase [Acidobacteriota bacterium]
MTLRDHLIDAKARLVAAGIETSEAARDALLLAMHATGWSRASIHARDTDPPPPGLAASYGSLIDRRTRREPIAYITGAQEFWNRDFTVSPAVLIPRPETELIIEEALSCVFGLAADIGTGSGCLAVTLAAEFPRARLIATDISTDALATARANASRHNVADRIEFRETRCLDGVAGQFDLIVSNPPYVTDDEYASLAPEVRFEPRNALASGPEGLDDIRGVLGAAEAHLAPGGLLLMEIGHGQADALRQLINLNTALELARISPDLQGIPRVVVAKHR